MIVSSKNMADLSWNKQQGLIPTVVQDLDSGVLLMQAFMSKDSLQQTLDTGLVTFFSRSRNTIWQKGETSGNVLRCVEISADCDNDSLKVMAKPTGPACHKGTTSCWDGSMEPSLAFLSMLQTVIDERRSASPDDSYTARLFNNGPKFIAQKVGEEAVETAIAASAGKNEEVLDESADLLFHLLVLLKSRDLSLAEVLATLEARHSP
jgi:phosphoribosyl-ATP pyrophosphohydrolase/phosphoribosyl-AMP cyclohydrolase